MCYHELVNKLLAHWAGLLSAPRFPPFLDPAVTRNIHSSKYMSTAQCMHWPKWTEQLPFFPVRAYIISAFLEHYSPFSRCCCHDSALGTLSSNTWAGEFRPQLPAVWMDFLKQQSETGHMWWLCWRCTGCTGSWLGWQTGLILDPHSEHWYSMSV